MIDSEHAIAHNKVIVVDDREVLTDATDRIDRGIEGVKEKLAKGKADVTDVDRRGTVPAHELPRSGPDRLSAASSSSRMKSASWPIRSRLVCR